MARHFVRSYLKTHALVDTDHRRVYVLAEQRKMSGPETGFDAYGATGKDRGVPKAREAGAYVRMQSRLTALS